MRLRRHVFHGVVHDASDSIKAGTYTASLNILKRDGFQYMSWQKVGNSCEGIQHTMQDCTGQNTSSLGSDTAEKQPNEGSLHAPPPGKDEAAVEVIHCVKDVDQAKQ